MAQQDDNDDVTIQLMSDLHLEMGDGYKTFRLEPCAPYLALLGDIGNIVDERLYPWLERLLQHYEIVFFVLGNHEPYGSTIVRSKERFSEFRTAWEGRRANDTSLGEFVVLDQTRYDINEQVTILGCTLYSNITPQQADDVKLNLNDFYHIKEWRVESHNAAHNSDVAWVTTEVAKLRSESPSKRVIVMTHYCPTFASEAINPRYLHSKVSSGYSTDVISGNIDTRQVKLWAFGHTHYNCDFWLGDTRIYTNQRGYICSLSNGFDERKVLTI